MTLVTKARVIKGAIAASTFDAPLLPGDAHGSSNVKRVPAAIVDAHLEAKRILDSAKRDAAALVEAAATNAQMAAQVAADEAREREVAKVAARFVALRLAEESAASRDVDRTMALAVALAERLLGAALELDGSRIAHLANQALEEARGARVTKIRACPLDVRALTTNLDAIAPSATAGDRAFAIEADDTLARGSLVVETNLGTLDAQLTPQLERLAAALREHVAPR